MRPNVSIVWATIRPTSLAIETSVTTKLALPPRATISLVSAANSLSRRAARTTWAPRAAKASLVALPIPLLAPVIRATLSFISDIKILQARLKACSQQLSLLRPLSRHRYLTPETRRIATIRRRRSHKDQLQGTEGLPT